MPWRPRLNQIHRPSSLECFYLFGGLFLLMCYFWVLDDAFVYFRYVDNLLILDIGLVYNQGEYVEGFSSPAWLLLLVLLRATHMHYFAALRLLGVGCFVVFWFCLVQLNRWPLQNEKIINFPLAYLSFNYSVMSYFSSGLGTPLVQLTGVVYALYIVFPVSRALQFFIGLSPLVRHELSLPFILCSLWAWRRAGRFPTVSVVTAALSLGGWALFRVYYYADLFPNTFYLKNVWDVKQGLIYVQDTLATYHFYVVAVVFVLLGFLLRRKGGFTTIGPRLMMVTAALSVVAYEIKIGGDARSYRFLAFPFPLLVCAFSGMLEQAVERFLGGWLRRRSAIIGLGTALVTFSLHPPQLSKHPFFRVPRHDMLRDIVDPASHRDNVNLSYLRWAKAGREMRRYVRDKETFRYEDTIATHHCIQGYLQFYDRVIHTFGLTEPILARTEMEHDRPGHKKGLSPLARDIASLYRGKQTLEPGLFRNAVESGEAPEWIARHLATIEVIEKKMWNRHHFRENLALAVTFPPKIEP